MHLRWFGHSSFLLTGATGSVFIDPFGDMSPMAERGLSFDYPAIESVSADLVLVTHDHRDHNAVDVIGGDPTIVRWTAGRLPSPIGEVVGIASEHDRVAGTKRGANTIFVFSMDDLRIAHFGDFGQARLRDEQAHAIGAIDLLMVPVGGVATADSAEAHAIVDRLQPRWVVPMHYRTFRINFAEPADAFLSQLETVINLPEPTFDTGQLPAEACAPVAAVPACP